MNGHYRSDVDHSGLSEQKYKKDQEKPESFVKKRFVIYRILLVRKKNDPYEKEE